MDDASLAPTPESEIEMKRKIYLRDREAAPIGPRSSLDAFVEKLKHEVTLLFPCSTDEKEVK